MDAAELTSLIMSRRSVRAWTNKPVPESLLLKAIELGTHAPNAGNQQNWYFYLILNKRVIVSVADAVQDVAERIASWPETSKLGEAAGRMLTRASFFRDAPAAIAVAARQYVSPLDEMTKARDKKDPAARVISQSRSVANARIQSVSAAIAYVMLSLHQMGLGAVWMTGPMQAKSEIEKILEVPPEMDLVAFIPVGYPAEITPSRERKPVSEVCRIIKEDIVL